MNNKNNSELIVKTIERELSDDERLSIADELGMVSLELAEKTKAAQLAAAHHKGLVATVKSRLETLIEILASNKEEIDVQCRPDYFYNEGVVRLVNVDTGEVVEERPLTAQERQMNIMVYPDKENPEGSPKQ